jgi:hypothetical protein
MITIAVLNESTAATDAQIQTYLPAFTTQWNRDLAPAWGLDQVTFVFVPKGASPPAGAWWLVWLDDSDQADALAYHDVTDEALPLSKVFVKTILADKTSLSVAATHELCEMAVDPTINLAAQDAQGTFWAYEVADPVEDDQYAYKIDDVLVTDFALPAWFGYKNSRGPFDFQNRCSDAFQVLSGGYAQEFGSSGWTQVNGSKVAKERSRNASKGSRRERRARGAARWVRSRPVGRR